MVLKQHKSIKHWNTEEEDSKRQSNEKQNLRNTQYSWIKKSHTLTIFFDFIERTICFQTLATHFCLSHGFCSTSNLMDITKYVSMKACRRYLLRHDASAISSGKRRKIYLTKFTLPRPDAINNSWVAIVNVVQFFRGVNHSYRGSL